MSTASILPFVIGLGVLLVLGLGFIGIFVPVLPTVPFILLSAFAAARGSERLHRRLLEHPANGDLHCRTRSAARFRPSLCRAPDPAGH